MHLAAQYGHIALVALLLERSADASAEDDLYHGTPAGWAEQSKQTQVGEYLRSHQKKTGCE